MHRIAVSPFYYSQTKLKANMSSLMDLSGSLTDANRLLTQANSAVRLGKRARANFDALMTQISNPPSDTSSFDRSYLPRRSRGSRSRVSASARRLRPVSRRQWQKTKLPANYQRVTRAKYGNNRSAKGPLVKTKSKSARSQLSKKYPQNYRITQYVMNPKVCYDAANHTIKNRDSVIVEGSQRGFYKMMLWNLTGETDPATTKCGNQEQHPQQKWCFSTDTANTGLVSGYRDHMDGGEVNIGFDSVPPSPSTTTPHVVTVSGIPFSASSSEYQAPNVLFKGASVNLEITPLNVNCPAELFCKIVRYKNAMKPNFDFSDKGDSDIVQAAAYNDITKPLMNNDVTDDENFDTLFLFKKKVPPANKAKGFTKIDIKKQLKTDLLRTSTYMKTDLTDVDTLGTGVRPNFTNHSGLLHNNVMLVIGMRYLDDNEVGITQKNISNSSDIKDLDLRDDLDIVPSVAQDCSFKIRGFISSFFACRDIERNSTVHSSSVLDLHSRVTALEQHVANDSEHHKPAIKKYSDNALGDIWNGVDNEWADETTGQRFNTFFASNNNYFVHDTALGTLLGALTYDATATPQWTTTVSGWDASTMSVNEDHNILKIPSASLVLHRQIQQ